MIFCFLKKNFTEPLYLRNSLLKIILSKIIINYFKIFLNGILISLQQQRIMAEMCIRIFGPLLLDKPLESYPVCFFLKLLYLKVTFDNAF